MTPAIAITAEQRRTVLELLNRHLPDTAAWACGSRVKGTSRPASDLDLVVFARPEQSAQVAELREAFEESNLPFRVDLFVWNEVPESFRTRIEAEHAVLSKDDSTRKDNKRSRWRRCRIDDVAEKVAMGPFGSSIKVETFTPSGVPIISGQHLHGSRVDDEPGFNFISEEHAERLRGANVQRGDVIFTHAGNIGQVAYIPKNSKYERYVISQRQFYMRPNPPEVIPDFIVAYFKSAEGQHDLLANTSQVGVPSIAQPVTYLKSIEIPVPPIQEQRTIAHILGTLDDKIELNHRMNETLEAMARTLFKSWFVDFDPVRAKMEGRDTGLPKPIADLFPDRLVDSELGEIPVGWTVRHLMDCFEIVMGQSPPGHTYNDTGDGLPFFQGHSDFGFRYPRNRKFCTAPNRIAKPEDTLVSVRAPVGDLNMAWERCCIGRGVAALRYRARAASFTYYTMQALQARLRKYENTGTVFSAITRTQLTRLPIQQPSMELVHAFERLARGWDETIRRNTAQINTLVALRSVLLPRLVSGHLRMRDAMKFTGRTA